jgi:plastocyanin
MAVLGMRAAATGMVLSWHGATAAVRDAMVAGRSRDMRSILVGLAVLELLAVQPARAADLVVKVSDDQGRPVADAVVTVLPRSGGGPQRPPPERRTIDQKNLMFVPYIEVFRPGDQVVFRNSDSTRHHVYSFSPIKAFEFVLAPVESSQPQLLDKPGVVAVGCNIHDHMISYLYVSDAPWIAHSGASGVVTIHGLAAGTYDVRVWQPRLRPGRPDLVQSTTIVAGSGTTGLAFALKLLPDPRLQFDREHTNY